MGATLRKSHPSGPNKTPHMEVLPLSGCREGGVSYEEIADVLGGISLTAVKSIIFRGRAVLKNRLKPYLRSGEWQKK